MIPMPSFPQGEPAFIPLLKSHEAFMPNWDSAWQCQADELDAHAGIFISQEFPDAEELLVTAVRDLERFLSEAGLAGPAIPCAVKYLEGFPLEGYRLTVEANAILIEASDLEGIRRALYYLGDKLAARPFLKRGQETRVPWLKNRISRCFFGPIKRPPYNIDELMNDIDYYPAEYLSRLAHEGINGLWLTITFREICDTTLRPACADAARRIAKLRDTVERCRRYGIKIWTFCIEPCYWSAMLGNPLPEGAEELLGPGWDRATGGVDMYSFCPKSEKAQQYLYECTYSLYKAVPHLGGILNISFGERVTSCLSEMDIRSPEKMPCGSQCDLSVGDIFKLTNASMARGMRAASPEADFISWLYIPEASQTDDWIYKMPSKLNGEVALSCNFESGVTRRQLGVVRAGGDYWLSAIGPGDRFGRMAQAAEGHCEMSAKIQVGNSHEVATIPYVPVPGILYRKYRKMKAMGVRHVMQCWYFGNYPGLMNEAAGKLAFEDFTGTEDDFLASLAKPAWGKDWQHAVDAWKAFAEGYSNYPLDIQFQYYGPMHDGPVWPLTLKKNAVGLTRSWKPDDFAAGDAIGECMSHFKLHEVTQLSAEMSRLWHNGFQELQKADKSNHLLDFTLAEALDIQFKSGHNILKYYLLRNALVHAPVPDAKRLLAVMRAIVLEEMGASRKLAELCELDPRLGYHSEAEVFKYFPAKLLWRADMLQELLDSQFAQAEHILEANGSLEDFINEINLTPCTPGNTYGSNGIHWSFEADAENLTIHIDFDGNGDYDEAAHIIIYDIDCAVKAGLPVKVLKRNCQQTATGWHADVTVNRAAFSYASMLRVGIEREEYLPGSTRHTNDKPGEFLHDGRLNFGMAYPQKTSPIRLD